MAQTSVTVYSTNFKTCRVKASSTVTAGYFQKVGTDGFQNAGDNTTCMGVAMSSASDGEYFALAYGPCVVLCDLAGTHDPDVGDAMYLGGAYSVDSGQSSQYCCGYVIDTDPSAGGDVSMLMLPPPAIQHAG